jgi:hypothetical protein
MRRDPTLVVAGIVMGSAFLAAAQSHQLGTVHFPTSCSTSAQADFERGVAMLHSYWFNYAGKTFRGVLEKDPGCAIAYWGIALDLLGNTLVSPPSPADAGAAWDALEKARSVGPGSQRERDWIETARAYFRQHETVSVPARLQAYRQALQELAARYPDDFEAQVFYALALQASAPKNDMTYASQLKSAGILERLYAQNPQHPGITHYLIHAYDFAPFAEKGIPAARRFAEIAPAVPHARHMPSHIYSMVGQWEDSIGSNLSALEISAGLLPRRRLCDLRLFAARAGREGRRHDGEGPPDTGARRSSSDDHQLHRACRDAGAVRDRAGGLDRRGVVAIDHQPVSAGRCADALRSRAREGAHRRRTWSEDGGRCAAGPPRVSREGR